MHSSTTQKCKCQETVNFFFFRITYHFLPPLTKGNVATARKVLTRRQKVDGCTQGEMLCCHLQHLQGNELKEKDGKHIQVKRGEEE